MICIKCGTKIPDASGAVRCPKCGAPLNNTPGVSGDTQVNLKGLYGSSDKTVILSKLETDKTIPERPPVMPGGRTVSTDTKPEYSPEDFAQFGQFDADGSNPYGIEMPGRPVTTQKHAGLGGDPTVVLGTVL